MSSTGSRSQGFLHPFRRHRVAGRGLRNLLRGMGRMRRAPQQRRRRGCCCCPAVFLLALAGVGLIGGFFYLGMQFLAWV